MAIVTVTSKGQIAIPAKTRKRMGIEKGTRLYVEERGDEIVMKPVTPEFLDRTAGILRGSVSLSRKLLESRALDRKREE